MIDGLGTKPRHASHTFIEPNLYLHRFPAKGSCCTIHRKSWSCPHPLLCLVYLSDFTWTGRVQVWKGN